MSAGAPRLKVAHPFPRWGQFRLGRLRCCLCHSCSGKRQTSEHSSDRCGEYWIYSRKNMEGVDGVSASADDSGIKGHLSKKGI